MLSSKRDIVLHFDEKKTTQAAAYLLGKGGGRMSYIKLIKLLYLADRRALLEWGRPITFDRYVSMDHGPVLSKTYNLINLGAHPGVSSYWNNHISSPEDYEVKRIDDPGTDELSEAEVEALDDVLDAYGDLDQWYIVDHVMHKLPEWKNPEGSALPITISEILRAGGRASSDISQIENELKNLSYINSLEDE